MNLVDQQREHFEDISDKYYRARQNPNHLLYKSLFWSSFFDPHQDILFDGASVIEPMCGYSEGKAILEEHCKKSISYSGFDFSETLVQRAKEKFPSAHIFVQDVTKFESDAQYDILILIGGLHHVYAQAGPVMERLVDAIKPGGHMIILEPTQNNFVYRRVRQRIYRSNPLFDDETERAFDLNELNEIFHQAGLVIKDQMYPGLLAYTLYYNPDAFPALNIGSDKFVRFLYRLEKKLYRSWLARKLSFATLSLLVKS